MGIVPCYALHHNGESIVSANCQVPILNSEFRTFRSTFELLFLSISCLLACLREPLLELSGLQSTPGGRRWDRPPKWRRWVSHPEENQQ